MKTDLQLRLENLELQMKKLLQFIAEQKGIDLDKEIEKQSEAKEDELFELKGKPKNQLRRELINEAKHLVDDIVHSNKNKYVYSFKVDEKKRVVSLVRLEFKGEDDLGFKGFTGKVKKKIAVADKDDVFNADIGRAILIGSMHGIDVSKFTEAVQPDTVVVGMKLKSPQSYKSGIHFVNFGDTLTVVGEKLKYAHDCYPNSYISSIAKIIDDTYAEYHEGF